MEAFWKPSDPHAPIRFVEDWTDSYEEFELVLEEVFDLGNEAVFGARPSDRQHRRGADALRVGQLAVRGGV
jgi:hypothetical protein